ncbi:hypothetical protein CPB86DRAFT_209597 [Serendipita vermifera]|nr:hypothetical protein CPB86DRAFT_209597 [Serendipita vermifera]
MAFAGLPDDTPLESIVSRIADGIRSLQHSRYTGAAAVTVYLYDLFITLDSEVEFVWSTFHFTIPNALYLLNRYVGLAFFINTIYDLAGFRTNLSEAYCRKPTQVVGFVLAHLSWTAIMAMRASALWCQTRVMVRIIWVLWVCTMGIVIATSVVSHLETVGGIIYEPLINSCIPTTNPRIMAMVMVAPTIYELFLTVLTTMRTFQYRSILGNSSVSPVLQILIRDGVIYFIMSTTIAVANILSWYFLPISHAFIFLYLYWGLVAALISRFVLNLRLTSRRNPFIGETTAGIMMDPQTTIRPARTTELPNNTTTQVHTVTDIGYIDEQEMSGGSWDKISTEQGHVNADQSSEVIREEGEDSSAEDPIYLRPIKPRRRREEDSTGLEAVS